MKILHLCLSNFYSDGFSYQENELVRQNIKDKHDVLVIASTEKISTDGSLVYTQPTSYLGSDGAKVIRIPYRNFGLKYLNKKLRAHCGVYELISNFEPDIILFHGACGWEINTAASYVKANPETYLYVDAHEDFVNSARNVISKWVLHWAFYRWILRRNLKYITKLFPVAISASNFLRDFYGVPPEMLELYPLGGFVPDDPEYAKSRAQRRRELQLANDDILIVQSGKLDRSKKLLEALSAFRKTTDRTLHFVVAGRILPDIADAVNAHVASDPRIRLLGWQSFDELVSLLCAADVYCQPGTQSATMQMSLANRCAVVLDDIPSHHPYMDDNGWLVGPGNSLEQIFFSISTSRQSLELKQSNSHRTALRLLDYRVLANRLYADANFRSKAITAA
jgi:1,2-diacylglycerol 3-alpha-glucosyltransferase